MRPESWLPIARHLASVVLAEVRGRGAPSGQQREGRRDLKAGHALDDRVHAALADTIVGRGIPGIFEVEHARGICGPSPKWTAFVDPIDGSTNCERWVGDPGFAMAIVPHVGPALWRDVAFGYVRGLRSGDEYWTIEGASWYRSAFHGRTRRCVCDGPLRMADAITYLNIGYGPRYGAMAATLAPRLAQATADLRGFDSSATEIGHIARDAAHLRIERRGGSEGANLLAAMSVLRAAGGCTRGIDGAALGEHAVALDEPIDFICGSNTALVDEALAWLKVADAR